MVSVLASSAGGRGFDPRPGQTKDIKIGICCFSARHAALRSKSKDWLPRVRIMCLGKVACLPADCCFRELARKNPAQRVGLVQSRIHSSSLINMFSSWYAWNICHWTLSIIQSINQSIKKHTNNVKVCMGLWLYFAFSIWLWLTQDKLMYSVQHSIHN